MSKHLAVEMSITAASPGYTGRIAVLSAQISHDPLRTPQISVTAQTTIATVPLDPFTRAPATLRIEARSTASATLRDFDAAAPPATLGALEWSDKASTATPLDGIAAAEERAYDLELFCTNIVQDPIGGTATVELASADYVLEDITNAGFDWLPARDGDGRYRLKSALRQMLTRLNLPLTVPEGADGDVVIADENMRPWVLGETARAWLDELRAAHGAVWMVSATDRTMQPTYPAGPLNWYASDALEQQTEIGLEASSITGHARWCDGYLLLWRWTDADGVEHAVDDLATLEGLSWWHCRKLITERLDTPPTGLTAQQRLARAQAYRVQQTVVVPMSALPEPYLDLTTWAEARARLAELTYHYPAATAAVTLTGV